MAGIQLINLYVPNGASVDSDKYHYKLNWLQHLTCYIQEQVKYHEYMAVVGDFNIAPEECDVHDPLEWEGAVLVSPAERTAFKKLLELGFYDSFRQFDQEKAAFSWWDYRAAGFRRNRGLRIDHILLSRSLQFLCKHSAIDKEPRKAERPSDHAPVWVELDI